MIEQFYSIRHLSTKQLKELYSSYRDRGWVDFEYYDQMPPGVKQPKLSDEEVLRNIDASDPLNYFVFMIGMEEEEDGVMIGFGLTNHSLFGAYLHLDKNLLPELVRKYKLEISGGMDFPILGATNRDLN